MRESVFSLDAKKLDEMARRADENFKRWKESPAGFSAMGFGRVNSRGSAAELERLKADKQRSPSRM